jgi:hypothetical protein
LSEVSARLLTSRTPSCVKIESGYWGACVRQENGPEAKAFATAAFQQGKFELAATLFLQAVDFKDMDDVAGLYSNRSLALLKANQVRKRGKAYFTVRFLAAADGR